MTRRSERDTANFSIARDLEGEVNPACRQALNSVGFRRATNFLHNSTPHKKDNRLQDKKSRSRVTGICNPQETRPRATEGRGRPIRAIPIPHNDGTLGTANKCATPQRLEH